MRNFFNRSFRPGYGYEDRRDYRLNAPSFYDYLAQFQGMLSEFESYLNTHGQEVKKEVDRILKDLHQEYQDKHKELQNSSQSKITHLTLLEEEFLTRVAEVKKTEEEVKKIKDTALGYKEDVEIMKNAVDSVIDKQNERIKSINGIMDVIYPDRTTIIGNNPKEGTDLIKGVNGRLNYINLMNNPRAGVGVTYARVTDLRGVMYEYITPYIEYARLALPTLHEDVAMFEYENIGMSDNLINQLRTYPKVYTGIVLADGNSASAYITIKGNQIVVGLRNFQGLDPNKPYYGDIVNTSFTDWVVKTEGKGEDLSLPLTPRE